MQQQQHDAGLRESARGTGDMSCFFFNGFLNGVTYNFTNILTKNSRENIGLSIEYNIGLFW